MTWLLPSFAVLRGVSGRARTVGNPSKAARTAARNRRYCLGQTGQAWRERNRDRRNAYHLAHYYANYARRRAYLTAKQREYRARQQAAKRKGNMKIIGATPNGFLIEAHTKERKA